MNVWLMNHYASTMFFDKAGRHYWFAKKLEERGNRVTVFCASTLMNKTDTVDTGAKKWVLKETGGTPFIFVKAPQTSGNGLDRVRNMFAFYRNLFPAVREYLKQAEKPDVIIASSVHPLTLVAGLKIAKKLQVPCICEIRDLWPEAIFFFSKIKEKSLLGKLLTAGEHWIYKRADALVFTKEGDTDYLKEKGWTTAQGGNVDLKKCHYINNGVDLASYAAHIDDDRLEDDDINAPSAFNVVYTGTIRPVNNVGNLLDCAKALRSKAGYENVRFLIYGDGSELPVLQKRVEDEGIDNVKLKGFIARKYVPYILSRSSVNILNYSQTEYNWSRGNSSNKLFEYMASGKPVISTVKMGYSIINKYGFGRELEECTPECLAGAIAAIHDMPAQEYARLGVNARAAAEEFDFDKLTDKLVSVIEDVTK